MVKLMCNVQYLILKVGCLSVWLVSLSTDFSQHPVPTHPSPQQSTLLRWGDGWMGTGCWYSGLPHGSCSMQHASQQSATYDPISITPAAGRAARRGETLQHVDSVGMGRPMLCACWRDIEESTLWHTDSRVTLLTHKLHVGYLFT